MKISLNDFYRAVSTTRQNVHVLIERMMKSVSEERNVLRMAAKIRKDHPTMCSRYMYSKLGSCGMGRDKFEQLCREHGFGSRRSVNSRKTTDSRGVERFENLLEGVKLTGPDQAWSSDITYFEMQGRFFYLTFIVDIFSSRLIGWSASRDLRTISTTLPALKMALRGRKIGRESNIIFHSDGGGQYYCNEFTALTKAHGMRNSMCETAQGNGHAERINGTVKNNYLIPYGPKNFDELCRKLDRAVQLYNHEKPHRSLQMETPVSYEMKWSKLHNQTQADDDKVIGSKINRNGASSPASITKHKPRNRNVLSAIH